MKIKPKIPSDIVGKIPSLGITKYIRNGTVVTRSSSSCTGKKIHPQAVRTAHAYVPQYRLVERIEALHTSFHQGGHNLLAVHLLSAPAACGVRAQER